MKKFTLIPLGIAFLILAACAQFSSHTNRQVASLPTPADLEGIWSVQGTNNLRGPYNGELELRRTVDGTFNVVRIVKYINFYYEGLNVQEVWTGKAVLDNRALTVSYTLKQADYMTRLGPHTRKPEDFKSNLNVLEIFEPTDKGLKAIFQVGKSAIFSEQVTTRRDLEPAPLWKDQRVNIEARGDKVPWLVRSVIKGFKLRVGFDKDPVVKSYSQRPEFKNETPYMVFDPTDYDFYQKNKDTLRVTNKITDEISLAEVLVKRNAYAPSIEEKARGYEKNTQERHFNAANILVINKVDSVTKKRTPEIIGRDSAALWTAMYTGSQAMRFLATQDKEALANVRKTVKAMFLLLDVTGDPKEFARTVAPYDANSTYTEDWHRGQGPFQQWMWQDGGNNDMVKGILHAFMWATLVVPKTDSEIWDQLREKSQRLIHLNVMKEKPQNKPAALGLAALINNDPALREKYLKSYKSLRTKVSGYNFNIDFYWRGSADWSGINLGMVGGLTNILLADQLGAPEIRDQLRERMMDSWVVYRSTRRHMLTFATYAFAYRHGIRGDKFQKESNDAEFEKILADSFWGLREVPYPRPTFMDVEIDHSMRPEWCLSPIPRLFWKAAKTPPPPVSYFYQGLYNYPLYEQEAFSSNFIWKDGAFSYQATHPQGLEVSGVDYLYAYWMARYAGLIK